MKSLDSNFKEKFIPLTAYKTRRKFAKLGGGASKLHKKFVKKLSDRAGAVARANYELAMSLRRGLTVSEDDQLRPAVAAPALRRPALSTTVEDKCLLYHKTFPGPWSGWEYGGRGVKVTFFADRPVRRITQVTSPLGVREFLDFDDLERFKKEHKVNFVRVAVGKDVVVGKFVAAAAGGNKDQTAFFFWGVMQFNPEVRKKFLCLDFSSMYWREFARRLHGVGSGSLSTRRKKIKKSAARELVVSKPVRRVESSKSVLPVIAKKKRGSLRRKGLSGGRDTTRRAEVSDFSELDEESSAISAHYDEVVSWTAEEGYDDNGFAADEGSSGDDVVSDSELDLEDGADGVARR